MVRLLFCRFCLRLLPRSLAQSLTFFIPQKQRVQYHYRKAGKKSSMTDERIAKLESIGFAWVAPGFHQKGERPGRKRKRTDEELSGGEEGMTEDDLGEDTGGLALSDDDGAAVLVANVARAPYCLNQPAPHPYHHHIYP